MSTRYVRIESVNFSNVFLRADGSAAPPRRDWSGGVVNCQYGPSSYGIFRLVPQSDKAGVFTIGSVAFPDLYLRLEGFNFQDSDAGDCAINLGYGATGQLDGGWNIRYGRCLLVDLGEGKTAITSDFYFHRKSPTAEALPLVVRMDGTGVTAFAPGGGGKVNLQSGVGGYEPVRLIDVPEDEALSATTRFATIESKQFPGRYLRMDGAAAVQANKVGASGYDTVNLQHGASSYEVFRIVPQGIGEIQQGPGHNPVYAIGSAQFPKAYLRLDAGTNATNDAGGGTVNCQFDETGQMIADGYERFKFVGAGDEAKYIESIRFPGTVVRLDGSNMAAYADKGGGIVNARNPGSFWEKVDVHIHEGNRSSSLLRWQREIWSEAGPGQVDCSCVAFGKLWVAKGNRISGYDVETGASGPVRFLPTSQAITSLLPFRSVLCAAQSWPVGGELHLVSPDGGDACQVASGAMVGWVGATDDALFVLSSNPYGSPYCGIDRLAFSVAQLQAVDEKRLKDVGSVPISASYRDSGVRGMQYGPQGPLRTASLAAGTLYVAAHLTGDLGLGDMTLARILGIDARTMQRKWDLTLDTNPGPVFAADGRFCFATEDHAVHVYDAESRSSLSKVTMPAAVKGAPTIVAGRVFSLLEDGRVFRSDVDGATASQVASLLPPPQSGTSLVNSDTIYYAADTAIHAVDSAVADGTTGVQDYTTYLGTTLAGIDDGAVVYTDMVDAGVVTLNRTIFVESTLIRDFDFVSESKEPNQPSKLVKSVPNFQVVLALTKKDGTPDANCAIEITASDDAEVTYGGVLSTISGTQKLSVMTDGEGRVRLAVAAGLAIVDDKGKKCRRGFSAPHLFVVAPGVDANMRFVVAPDGPLLRNLGSFDTGDAKKAKGYDGVEVLKSEYSNDNTKLSAAVGAINTAAGMATQPVRFSRKAQNKNSSSMVCDPACDMTVACCIPAASASLAPTCRQPFRMDLTASTPVFKAVNGANAEAEIDKVKNDTTTPTFAQMASKKRDGLSDTVSDVWGAIKHGAEIVTVAVTTVAEKVVAAGYAVYNEVRYRFDEAIDKVTHAALVVQGIVNTIVEKVEKFVEALSFLFDWDAILKVRDDIKSEVQRGWDRVPYADLKLEISNYIQEGKRKVDDLFASARQALGSQSSMDRNADVSRDKHPAQNSSQDSWLIDKFKDNTRQKEDSSDNSVFKWPAFQLTDEVSNAFDDFSRKCKDAIKADLEKTMDQVRDAFGSGSTDSFLNRALSAVLAILEGVADVTLDLADAVAGLLIDLLKAFQLACKSYLSDSVTIPFVSDLYLWATGDELSFLDLFALLAAIPASFVQKVSGISRDPAYSSDVSPKSPIELLPTAGSGSARRDYGTPHVSVPPLIPDPLGLGIGVAEILAGVIQAVWGGILAYLNAMDYLAKVPPLPTGTPTASTPLLHQFTGSASPKRSPTLRMTITIGFFFLARGMLAIPLAIAKTRDAVLPWLAWTSPSLTMATDVLLSMPVIVTRLVSPGALPTWMTPAFLGKVGDIASWIGAAVALALGLALMAFAITIYVETKNRKLVDVLALVFAILVGAALSIRWIPLAALNVKDPTVLFIGFLITVAVGALILFSGAVAMLRGFWMAKNALSSA